MASFQFSINNTPLFHVLQVEICVRWRVWDAVIFWRYRRGNTCYGGVRTQRDPIPQALRYDRGADPAFRVSESGSHSTVSKRGQRFLEQVDFAFTERPAGFEPRRRLASLAVVSFEPAGQHVLAAHEVFAARNMGPAGFEPTTTRL